MKKIALSLFIVAMLLVAPLAHAAGMGCEGDNCQTAGQVKKASGSITQDTQDNDSMAKAAHHCCYSHLSAIPDMPVAGGMVAVSAQAFFAIEQDALASRVVGPPLKPPSHL